MERNGLMRQFTFVILLLVSACTTPLVPGGESVKVTTDQKLVTSCRSLGFVEAEPPFSTPGDARDVMKNKAALLGGNMLFVTKDSLKAMAYSCDGGAYSQVR